MRIKSKTSHTLCLQIAINITYYFAINRWVIVSNKYQYWSGIVRLFVLLPPPTLLTIQYRVFNQRIPCGIIGYANSADITDTIKILNHYARNSRKKKKYISFHVSRRYARWSWQLMALLLSARVRLLLFSLHVFNNNKNEYYI